MSLWVCRIRRSYRLPGVEIVEPRRSYGLRSAACLVGSREIAGAPEEAMEAVENVPRTPRFPRAPTATAAAGTFTALLWARIDKKVWVRD